MNHKDLITKYATLKTISEFIDRDTQLTLNYHMIHDLILPATVQMCEHVTNSHLIWPLLKTVATVMERIQYQDSFEPFKHIQSLNFNKLLSSNNATIKDGIIEIFKRVIVAVPFGRELDYVFDSGLAFFKLCLPKMEAGEVKELVFWKFLIKEITMSERNRELVGGYAKLLSDYYPRFSNFEDPNQINESLALVDEYLLLLRELPFE
jgi:hypothetical protein